jgi:peptidyl-prolyl cis-trans isomerase B (cyclophilin B)
VANNKSLDHIGDDPHVFGYAVFGKVVDGMEVVSGIQHVQTIKKGIHDDWPKDLIVIQKASIIEE